MSPADPALCEIKAGATYAHDGQRLFSPAAHLSFLIPKHCTGAALLDDIVQIKRASPAMEATLYLHEGGRLLSKSWIDEDIVEQQETLRPTGAAQTVDGVISREFVSPSYRGRRVKLDDVWGNGVSAIFRGPAKAKALMLAMVARVVESVRFIQRERLSEEQIIPAITAYLNTKEANNLDLTFYIDRHFYMVRDEVIETLRLLSEQTRREGHAAADVAAARLESLVGARAAIDRGLWDLSVADLRTVRRR